MKIAQNHINNLPPRIVLWGGASLAEMMRETIEYYGSRIVLIIDDTPGFVSPFQDIQVCRGIEEFREWLKEQDRGSLGFFITISGHNGRIKLAKAKLLEEEGLKPVTIAHHTAWIARDAKIGIGTLIDANAVVMAKAKIGNHCNIGPSSSIGHHDELGDAVDTSAGSTIGGYVQVGDNVWIGLGCAILSRLTIGDDSTIGCGSVVLRDVPPGITVLGNPARHVFLKPKK